MHFNDINMQKNAAALTTVCILLCFAFNYTFPLHRQTVGVNYSYANSTQHWDDFLHQDFISGRTKKLANKMENSIRNIKMAAQEFVRPNEKGSKRDINNKLSEEDFRQYEHLVIMKKYPYLDLKDLELKYSPLSKKNIRHTARLDADVNFRSDNNFDPEEDLKVEITNRGLSGFSIPTQVVKSVALQLYDKSKSNNVKVSEDKYRSLANKKSSKRALEILKTCK